MRFSAGIRQQECNCTENFHAYPLQDLQFGLVRQRMDDITLFAIFHAYPLLYLFSVPQQLEQ